MFFQASSLLDTVFYSAQELFDIPVLLFRSVNEMTTAGQTALHLAAESNLSDVCSILLSNGVDYSAVDSRGNNALHLAVKEGHIAVARVLVSSFIFKKSKEFKCSLEIIGLFLHESFRKMKIRNKLFILS
jgi:ankyrin repeat protein